VQLAHTRANQLQDPEICETIEKAETQINKMTRLIRDFLNAAQSESGKMVLYRQEFFLDELIREIIADLSVDLRRQQITLNDCPPIKVNADREKIEQVLGNLIGNALKYSTGHEPVVLTCFKEENRIIVRVDDRGPGISSEDKLHLFDRFFRSENANSRSIAGFGIGLYVSAAIVKLHGGDIGADSEIGQGSSFWFDLPEITLANNPLTELVMK
jgi:two-component system sensor histidine kinase VicK